MYHVDAMDVVSRATLVLSACEAKAPVAVSMSMFTHFPSGNAGGNGGGGEGGGGLGGGGKGGEGDATKPGMGGSGRGGEEGGGAGGGGEGGEGGTGGEGEN